ncbi:Receptor-like protein 18 [Sesamum angolense]|uniref:Receptor-like protein 18 n=1 Tax=Sesamum angolense TaxID=2727404 RepID=A0AAE1WA02_9LAMI|nr:Receptor-like protein 18 [Sesamum angolense]
MAGKGVVAAAEEQPFIDSSSSTKLVHWNQNVDCCSWDGVVCDSSGHVISLDLESEFISGGIGPFRSSVPAELSEMRSLVSLDLSSSFEEILPLRLEKPNLKVIVQNLTGLRELYLNGVNISAQTSDWCQALSSSLPDLRSLSLRRCGLSGPLHSSLSELQALSVLQLDRNNLSNHSSRLLRKFLKLDNLDLQLLLFARMLSKIDLSNCGFIGQIPSTIANLTELVYLDLSFNSFTGSIPLLHMSKKLAYIDLRRNSLTGSLSSVHFEGLSLLEFIHIAYNKLNGSIPPSLFLLPALQKLQLSNNKFSGQGEFPLPPASALYVDYSRNNFRNPIPLDIGNAIPYAMFFSLANNGLTGTIPASLCNATYLQVLDLSANNLNGSIPPGLVKDIKNLGVLNLGRNNISGDIPDTFPVNCGLKTLDLSRNNLGGKIPLSLANCKSLEVMNVGNNKIDDGFPCSLKYSSSLRVLVLRSNKFHGDIICPEVNQSWPNLQIIDVASNNFSGHLRPRCISSWRGMTIDNDAPFWRNYLSFNILDLSNFYYDTVTVTAKGREMELVKILTIFTSIDFSSNNFIGDVPSTIGDLTALYILNLLHNSPTGTIPKSFGNSTQLESLAFQGNTGLCGYPLKTSCNPNANANVDGPAADSGPDLEETEFDWQYVFIGLGYGLGAALAFASLPFCRIRFPTLQV